MLFFTYGVHVNFIFQIVRSNKIVLSARAHTLYSILAKQSKPFYSLQHLKARLFFFCALIIIIISYIAENLQRNICQIHSSSSSHIPIYELANNSFDAAVSYGTMPPAQMFLENVHIFHAVSFQVSHT